MGFFSKTEPEPPENQHSQIREENIAASGGKARKTMFADGQRLLRMAEEAEAAGDMEKAQAYRRTLGD